MAKHHYPWQRFWVERDSRLQVDEAGFLLDPSATWIESTSTLVADLAQLEDISCVVLLGEPGSGKTTTLNEYRDNLRSIHENSRLNLGGPPRLHLR